MLGSAYLLIAGDNCSSPQRLEGGRFISGKLKPKTCAFAAQ